MYYKVVTNTGNTLSVQWHLFTIKYSDNDEIISTLHQTVLLLSPNVAQNETSSAGNVSDPLTGLRRVTDVLYERVKRSTNFDTNNRRKRRDVIEDASLSTTITIDQVSTHISFLITHVIC